MKTEVHLGKTPTKKNLLSLLDNLFRQGLYATSTQTCHLNIKVLEIGRGEYEKSHRNTDFNNVKLPW
jgi:hypothetical protein